jgi:hypothetical protein
MQSFIDQMDRDEQLKSHPKITKNLSFDQSSFNKTLPNISSNAKALKEKN